jgi:hypothetical protein
VLPIEELDPLISVLAIQLGLGLLGSIAEKVGMASTDDLGLIGLAEHVFGKLADRPQHSEPDFAVSGFTTLHEPALHEGLQGANDVLFGPLTANSFCGLQTPTSREHREANKEKLFVGGQQIKAPLERSPQRSPALGNITRTTL